MGQGAVMLELTALSIQAVAPRTVEGAQRQQISDEALTTAIAAGDRGAMKALYERHNVRVYRFGLRLVGDTSLAEDVVSEVFLAVWRRAGAFKAKSRVSTWLLAIARHKALSALRGPSEQHFDDDDAAAIADPADNAEAIIDHQDRNAIIRGCLSQLSAIHREVLDLVYYHDKSVHEVAQIVGVPASTVKTRMFNARRRMESLLETAGVGLH
jgi:RNA polymerase sigma-70 factor, ECF subfamily